MLFFPAIVSMIYHESVSGRPNPAFIKGLNQYKKLEVTREKGKIKII